MPLVSIIVPVYNLENYLERCLDSLIRQTLYDIEVICINDASTDNSLAIIEQYVRKDARIKLYTTAKTGQGIGRNFGMLKARGAYIGFVDGDDSIHPDMFRELYHAAQDNDSEIAFCHALTLDPSGKKIPYPYYDKERKQFRSKEVITTFTRDEIVNHLSAMTVVSWNKIYRKSFLEQWDIRFGSGIIHEDIPFFYQSVLHAAKITLVRKPLYYYSANRPGSTTNAVMSMSSRLVEVLRFTREKIQHQFANHSIERQFTLFQTTQLLSFINYAFYRHELPNFSKLRFFLMVHYEFTGIPPNTLNLLSTKDRMQVRIIKKRQYKLFRVKTLSDVIWFHTKSLDGIRKLPKLLVSMFYYHIKYYIVSFLQPHKKTQS